HLRSHAADYPLRSWWRRGNSTMSAMIGSDIVKVLIVDDRPDKLMALEAVLGDLRTDVVAVRCGRDALRQLLHDEFAVILMDVNMPEMDGFETATLIRQRAKFRHTPIIFFTGADHEMHALKSYSLGAVDYISIPIRPEVLRAKVGVFVELARKTREVELQTESVHKKAVQLQKLASASVSINADPLSLEGKLDKLVEATRDIIGAHQVILSVSLNTPRRRNPREFVVWSLSDKYAAWRKKDPAVEGWRSLRLLQPDRGVIRLSQAEIAGRMPEQAAGDGTGRLPFRGLLAAQLVDASGARIGVLEVSDKQFSDNQPREFDEEDEALVVQLAQLGSGAIQHWINEGVRQADRIKDEFLGILSHELRTPLHAILGWTQHLRSEAANGSDLARGLDVIERNVKGQTALVEDLLDVSRITSGKLHIKKQHLSLRTLLGEVLDGCRHLAESKKLQFEVKLGEDPTPLHGDPNRLMQAFNNLLSNSIKFTPSGGRITVEMLTDQEQVLVRVSDTGEGISSEFLPFVFERFRQGETLAGKSQPGLGLGLAIVRHIIERHGGHVDVESEGLGRGATFVVRIPRAGALSLADSDIEPPSPSSVQTEQLMALR
ncbi:MAG TPA: ATP-binding protein, partial [Polyangiaceae bacterium]|nr:ATP-binding protein [Polyangiaceae bacterium]